MSTDKFKQNIQKLTKPTYNIGTLPKGITSFPNKWEIVFVDAQLTLLKHFKRKYEQKGERERFLKFFDQIGVEKGVRITGVYSPYKILRKAALEAKYKNPGRRARVFQYGNKFFPLDREDLTIMAVDVIKGERMLGPCLVVDLSSSSREDMGHPIGDNARQERVFRFLGVKEEVTSKDLDKEADKVAGISDKQFDLFNRPSDQDSVDIGFKTPEETEASVKKLDNVDNHAHKVRAVLLMIARAKATLKNTKDKTKKKNLLQSLKKWNSYKQKLLKQTEA